MNVIAHSLRSEVMMMKNNIPGGVGEVFDSVVDDNAPPPHHCSHSEIREGDEMSNENGDGGIGNDATAL